MAVYHPVPDEHGRAVLLKQPSQPTALASWDDPHAVATIIPNGDYPPILNGLPLADWPDVPTSLEGWHQVEGQCDCDEPSFQPPPGKMPAAGVVIEEPDGRFWLVAPSNAFGGY